MVCVVSHVLMKSPVFIQPLQVAPSFVTEELKSRWSNKAICRAREEYQHLFKETVGNLLSLGSSLGSLYQRLTGRVESRCSTAWKQRNVWCSFSSLFSILLYRRVEPGAD